ncbi:MAG: ferritin-like domain-containing protein [Gemmataceae bacterium]
MERPQLKWVQHELTIPASSPLWSLVHVHNAATNQAIGRLRVDLPDLSAYPDPLDKIRLLLSKAAEVEHALLVQYLYSAYSLAPPTSVTDPQQQASLRGWRRSISQIAREEMGHLMTVQNLRLLVSLEPDFGRDDFPMVAGLFPFDTHLSPLTQRILAQYIVAESPPDAQGIEDIIQLATGGGSRVNRVGVLYALIGVALAKDLGEVEVDAAGGDPWSVMVRQIAYLAYEQNPPSSTWHLPGNAFNAASQSCQGQQDDWAPVDTNIRIFAVASRADAKLAIGNIGIQGEGVSQSADTQSHFYRFLKLFRGDGTITPFPTPGGWNPTLDVPTDPKTVGVDADPSVISHPTTALWAKLADVRYAILLGCLEEYLKNQPLLNRQNLCTICIDEMRTNFRGLSDKLVAMNRKSTGTAKAALPFELPTSGMPLPSGADARRQIHIGRLNQAIALEEMIIASQGDAFIQAMRTKDQNTLSQFQPPP